MSESTHAPVAIAEEVTIAAADAWAHEKRLDVALYVNGSALGVLELKRSMICVAEPLSRGPTVAD